MGVDFRVREFLFTAVAATLIGLLCLLTYQKASGVPNFDLLNHQPREDSELVRIFLSFFHTLFSCLLMSLLCDLGLHSNHVSRYFNFSVHECFAKHHILHLLRVNLDEFLMNFFTYDKGIKLLGYVS